jgi:hypothetical protein
MQRRLYPLKFHPQVLAHLRVRPLGTRLAQWVPVPRTIAAPSGLNFHGEGWFPRALPWAILFQPFGLEEGMVFFHSEAWHMASRSQEGIGGTLKLRPAGLRARRCNPESGVQ